MRRTSSLLLAVLLLVSHGRAAGHQVVDLRLRGGLGSRLLAYEDDRFRTLPSYEVRATPVWGAASAYRLMLDERWSLGFHGDAELAPVPAVRDGASTVRGRWWTAQLGPQLGYSASPQRFTVGLDYHAWFADTGSPSLPSMSGAGPRLRFGLLHQAGALRWEIDGAAGPSWVNGALTDAGSFPRATFWSMEVSVFAGWQWSARSSIGFRWVARRLVGALGPRPDDLSAHRNQVAGGLLDRQESLLLEVAHSLGGSP